jgi:rod shape-determining protein MreD
MIKNLLLIIPCSLAIILQISFFPAFEYLVFFNLILSFILFVCIIISYEKSLIYALILGFVLDIFSSMTFGLITISFFLTLYITNKLFHALFTNKSVYTLLALGIIASAVYNVLLFCFNYFFYFIQLSDLNIILNYHLVTGVIWQIVFCSVFLMLSFVVYNSLSKRLKSVFIIPE